MPKVILVFVIATFQTTTCLPENLTGVVTYVMQTQKIHWANGLNAVLAISTSKSDPSIRRHPKCEYDCSSFNHCSILKNNLLMGNIRITSFYQSIDLKKNQHTTTAREHIKQKETQNYVTMSWFCIW